MPAKVRKFYCLYYPFTDILFPVQGMLADNEQSI